MKEQNLRPNQGGRPSVYDVASFTLPQRLIYEAGLRDSRYIAVSFSGRVPRMSHATSSNAGYYILSREVSEKSRAGRSQSPHFSSDVRSSCSQRQLYILGKVACPRAECKVFRTRECVAVSLGDKSRVEKSFRWGKFDEEAANLGG